VISLVLFNKVLCVCQCTQLCNRIQIKVRKAKGSNFYGPEEAMEEPPIFNRIHSQKKVGHSAAPKRSSVRPQVAVFFPLFVSVCTSSEV